jgi:uncharacterized protein (TIGR03437 family)
MPCRKSGWGVPLLGLILFCPSMVRATGSCPPSVANTMSQQMGAFILAHMFSNPRFDLFRFPTVNVVEFVYDGEDGQPVVDSDHHIATDCLPTFVALAGNALGTFQPSSSHSRGGHHSDQAPPNPALSTSLPSGTASTNSVAADFNDDGQPDFATLNSSKNVVNVYLGNSDGSLAPVVTYSVGNMPLALVAADINGDGHPDLIVANSGDNTVSVLLGNANGTFQTAKTYPAGNNPLALALADVNSDGIQDLIVANCPNCIGLSGAGAISVLPGLAGGAFGAPVPVAQDSAPATLVAADFNGDGKVDIAYGSFLSSVASVVLGNGLGGFSSPMTSPSAGAGNYFGFGDFNGDGKLDLAVLDNFRNLISILPGIGDGSFGPPVSYVAGTSPGNFSLLDLAGTGHLDLAAGDQVSGSISLLAGRPDGTFVGPRAYPTSDMPAFIAAGDFNGDGKPDLVSAAKNATSLSLFTNVGKGTFQGPTAIALPAQAAALASGDFNGDGKADLAVATPNGIEIFLGQANGGFGQPLTLSTGAIVATALATADFNGDSKLDLAVAGSNMGQGSIQIYFGDGTGGFQLSQTFPAGTNPTSLAIADLNEDGHPDVVMVDSGQFLQASQTGGVFVLLSQAGGTFADPVSFAAGTNPAGVAAGDLNGDGKPDLAVATSTLDASGFPNGTLAIFFNQGHGTFGAPTTIAIDSGPLAIAITDVNLDGVPDVIVSNCCGFNDLNVLLGNGDGTFQPLVEVPVGVSPQGLAIADFDGNGKLDLAIAASAAGGIASSGYVTVLLNAPLIGPPVVTVNAGSYIPGAVAPGSIVAGFGWTLAPSGASALQQVGFFDSAGNTFVCTIFSTNAGQADYQIPASVALGNGTAFFFGADGSVVLGSVNIVPVAPGIFTVGSNSLAAAQVVTTDANNEQITTSTANCTSTGCVAVPINLGSPSEQVFLLLFATGIRAAQQSQVMLQIGGMTLTPAYAGPQGTFDGLDQINVKLPSTLKGSGDVIVQVTAAGKKANPVHITIE